MEGYLDSGLNEEIAPIISKMPAWSKASHEIIIFQFSLVTEKTTSK